MFKDSLHVNLREVELKAGGTTLRALVGLPSAPTGWVIFAHEGGASLHASALGSVARRLNEAGLATLSVELLTPAEAARRSGPDSDALAERLLAGTEWVRSEADEQVGILGAGEGAAAALSAAAETAGRIASVVAVAPRLEAAAHRLEAVGAPTLLIVGGADRRALKQARWARRRLANAEMVVVPGATRLFDAPAALRLLEAHSVDWFRKTLVGEEQAQEIVREHLSREGRRRLAAVASLFLISGFALGPKAGAAVTAFFDATGTQNVQGFAGHLGIQIGATSDNSIIVGVDGSGNVTVSGTGGAPVVIDNDTATGSGSAVTVPAADVRRIVVNQTGQIGGAVTNGARTIDLSAVTPTNFPNIPTILGDVSTGATVEADNGTGANYYVQMGDGTGASTLIGSAFGDLISAGGGNDTIIGGDGPDHITGGGNQDTVEAGDGDDWMDFGNNSAANTPVGNCGPGDDTIAIGGYYNSTYDGGNGIDMFMTQGFIATEGNIMVLTGSPASGTVTKSTVGGSGANYTCTFTNMEIPVLAGRGSTTNVNAHDSLDASGWTGTLGVGFHDGGTWGNNGGGNDTIIGTGGPDSVTLNIGNDYVSLGGGTNFVSVNGGPLGSGSTCSILPTVNGTDSDRITFNSYDGATGAASTYVDTILGGAQVLAITGTNMATLSGGEAVGDTLDITGVTLPTAVTVNGLDGSDVLIGSANGDVLNGNAQNDTLYGRDGNDQVNGGNNDDLLFAEAGNDTLVGGFGNDTLDGAEGDDSLAGSDENDVLTAGIGNDTLVGGSGNDSLNGGADNDLYSGLSGVDAFTDASGIDTASMGTPTVGDQIQLQDTLQVFGDSNGNSMSGSGLEAVIGSGQGDTFFVLPGSTAWTLDGAAGSDTLEYQSSGLNNVTDNQSGNPTIASTISADSVQPVLYLNMESVDLNIISAARAWQVFE